MIDMERKAIAYIRTDGIFNDSRATKEISLLLEKGYYILLIGWDRSYSALEKCQQVFGMNAFIKYEFFNCSINHIGIKNFDKLIKWFGFVKKCLKKNAKDIDAVHACNLDTLEKYFIVRIAWVFGLNGKNFIKTMINVGKTHDTVRVVNDQIGTPTYTYDLARLLVDMIETEKYGYYHATNEGGYISWYDFCCEFYRQYGLDTKVIPVSTEEYGLSKAARPFNSRLDKSKLVEAGFMPLPTWQDAVSRYLKEAGL